MTERTIRQATRTRDGRAAAERIEFLELENATLRAEVARLREAEQRQRAEFVARVERELVASVKHLGG